MSPRSSTAVHLLALAAIVAAAFLPWLRTENHTSARDGRHAEISREMAERGDYVVPYVLGKPYTDKMPLFTIVTAALFRLTGRVDIGMARLPSSLSVMVMVLATYLLGRRWFSVRAALWAAAMEASFLVVLEWGLAVRSDTMLAAWFTLAILLADRSAESRCPRSSWLYWVGSCLAVSAAVLSKGALAGPSFLIPAIAIWRARRGRCVPPMAYLAAAVLLVALGPAAWGVASEIRSPGHVARVLEYQFSRTLGQHAAPFYEMPFQLLRGTGPWGLFALGAGWAAVRRVRRSGYDRTLIPALTLATGLVALSLSPSKRSHYLLPLIPMWALFLAGYLDQAAGAEGAAGSPRDGPAPRWLFVWPLRLCLVVVIATVATLAVRWVPGLGAGRVVPWLAYGAVGAATAYGILCAWRGRSSAAVGALLLAVLLVALVGQAAYWRLYRKPDPEFASARELGRAIPPGAAIGALETGSEILFFVLNRRVTFLPDSYPAMLAFLRQPGPHYLIVRTQRLADLQGVLPAPPRRIGEWTFPQDKVNATLLAIEP